MSSSAFTSAPVTKIVTTPAAAKPQVSEDDVGPSRVMEIGLHGLVTGLLIVSIIGIAYVYGFNLDTGSLLDNISAAVRALGVDGGFFLGLYFSRRLWMRRKRGWGDGIKTSLFGLIWFLVALLMASLSWFSNTLFVTNYQTIITADLLSKAGFTSVSPQLVNKAIGAIPLVIVLLYSIVPRRMQEREDTRTPEEIEEEALREAARIRAQNMVAAARAEGAGQRIRTVLGGLVGEALNLDERAQRDERLKQMRIALETAGYSSDDLSDEQVEIQVVARGLWDQAANKAIKVRAEKRSGAFRATTDLTAPLAQETDAATPGEGGIASPVLESDTVSVAQLAQAVDVVPNTVKYWMRPDFDGPTKFLPGEIIPQADGSSRIRSSALARLLLLKMEREKTERRNGSDGTANGKGTTRSSLGRVRAASKSARSNGNHQNGGGQFSDEVNPLTMPKLGEEVE